jgi:hypothetical protein
MRRVTRWLLLAALAAISFATMVGCAAGKTEPSGISGNPLPSTTTTTTSSS